MVKHKYTEKDRRYYIEHRSEVISKVKEWQKKHPKKKKESQKRWLAENPDYFKQYREKNKVKVLESQRRWRRSNREKYNEYQRKYNAKKTRNKHKDL